MESEDEEVIFENKALHQALNEMGVEDIDTEPVITSAQRESKNKSSEDEMRETSSNEDNIHRIPTDFFTKIFLSQAEIISMYQNSHKKTLDRLKSSPLLSIDDRCFLQSFLADDTDNEEKATRYTSPSLLSNLNLFRVLTINFGLCFAVFISFIMVHDMKFVPDWRHVLETDLFLFYPYILCPTFGLTLIFCLLKIFLRYKVCSKIKEMDSVIQDFEESAQHLTRIERKCIRRIRESELVARGFTLTSMSSNTNSTSHLLTQIDKRCPGFRSALFDGNSLVVDALGNSYKDLTESIPLVVDFKWVDAKPVQNFNSKKSSSSSSSSGLHKDNSSTSDGDSLSGPDENVVPTSQLVSSQELLNVHISTFMRRLVLCFFTDNCKDSLVNPYNAVLKAVENCRPSLDSVTSILNKHHSFYRAIHRSLERPEVTSVQTADGKKSKSPLELFYVFVNSLDLHLQTVFHMARDLTINLEQLVEEQTAEMDSPSDENNEPSSAKKSIISEEERMKWTDMLKGIKSEMDSCKSCYDEAVKFLTQRKENKPSSANQSNPPSYQSDAEVHKPVTTVIIPDAEPVIEDQVFEAIIGSDEDEEVKAYTRPTVTPEEKAQLRQQREDMSRFKQELKSVVDYRAVNQRKREERALARTRGKESSTTTPSETDGSLGGGEGDDEGEGSSSSTQQKKKTEKMGALKKQPPLPPQLSSTEMGGVPCETASVKPDLKTANPGKYHNGETLSLLAAKLDSADNCGNPSQLPWAPLMRERRGDAHYTNKNGNKDCVGHSPSSLGKLLPYDENWRSSVEKTKARHWAMCEKIIQENKDTTEFDNKNSESSSDPPVTSAAELDTSSFVDISSDDLLFYPIDTDTNSNNDAACTLISQTGETRNSPCSSNSQVLCPRSINPEEEGFRNIDGTYVSRHNFTASGKNSILDKALNEVRKQNVVN